MFKMDATKTLHTEAVENYTVTIYALGESDQTVDEPRSKPDKVNNSYRRHAGKNYRLCVPLTT
jgi:hypothetical protein